MDPDPHSFSSWIRIRIQYADADPDLEGKIFQIKTEKGKKLLITAILFNFKSKFAQSSIVSYFRVIFYVFYDYRKLFMSLFFTKFVKLDPDPHGFAFILPP